MWEQVFYYTREHFTTFLIMDHTNIAENRSEPFYSKTYPFTTITYSISNDATINATPHQVEDQILIVQFSIIPVV